MGVVSQIMSYRSFWRNTEIRANVVSLQYMDLGLIGGVICEVFRFQVSCLEFPGQTFWVELGWNEDNDGWHPEWFNFDPRLNPEMFADARAACASVEYPHTDERLTVERRE